MMMMMLCRQGPLLSLLLCCMIAVHVQCAATDHSSSDGIPSIESKQRVLQKVFEGLKEHIPPRLEHDNAVSQKVDADNPPMQHHPRQLLDDCGAVLASYTREQVRTLTSNTAAALLPADELALFRFAILPEIQYGLSVRKLCAACDEFEGLCPEDDEYGANVTMSGLAFFPLQGSTLLPGTHIGSILCHGTQSSMLDAPSAQWIVNNEDDNDNLALANLDVHAAAAMFAGTRGSVVILPDYMGYMESANVVFRAYLIRRAYRTATLPLWYKAQQLMADESNCTSALANAAIVSGYSEGGYAAVAVAQALQDNDVDILHVFAGGAPLRLGSAQLLFSLQQLRTNTFLTERRYYLALLGAAFSSTYPHVANYAQDQDWLEASVRDTVVNAVHSGGGRNEINAVLDADNLLASIDPIFIQILFDLMDNDPGLTNPCAPENVVPNVTDAICQALADQDLATLLETNVTYPVTLCHSLQDTLVAPSNRPNATLNPDHITLVEIDGSHSTAGVTCIVDVIQWYVLSAEWDDFVIEDLHTTSSRGCVVNSGPTSAPPNGDDDDDDDSSSISIAPTISAMMTVLLAWISLY